MTDEEAVSEAAAAWIGGFAEAMAEPEHLAARVAALNEGIFTAVPEVGADIDIRRVLDASTQAAVQHYFERLPHTKPGEIDPTPAMLGLGRILAQRGADATIIVRVYRAGLRALWHLVMSEVMSAPLADEVKAEILRYGWEHVSLTVDRTVELVVAEYVEEAEGRMRGAYARRAELVDAVLAGRRVDPDEASLAVGHSFSGHQLAMVLWCDDEAEHPIALLETTARAFAAAFGAAPPLTVPAGTQALWVWVRVRAGWSLDSATLPDLSNAPQVRAALGIPAYGLDGFRTSHEHAQRARTVAESSAAPLPVTYFGDVELVSALASDPEALGALVRRELGGLGAIDPAVARLRETVRVYLAAGSSVGAAEQLSVHKNTVLYRLQQAEVLLGHSVRERRLSLEVALTAAEIFGERVLIESD